MHEIAERLVSVLSTTYGVSFSHHRVTYTHFANGEVLPRIPETVRGQHVFFLHSLQQPAPNEALVSMLLTNDALGRASVSGITLILPHICYLRQDRKHEPRVPISGRVIADLIESNHHVERIITADMHSDQAQGFFSLPVDNLSSFGLFADFFARQFGNDMSQVVVVSPDFGAAVRSRRFAKLLGDVPVAIFEKRRARDGSPETVTLIGESIAGKTVIVSDDMIDTGGTIRSTIDALTKEGARQVFVCATHGIFSAGADKHFEKLGTRIVCTDSIPRDAEYAATNASWLTIVSMADVLANAVYESTRVGGSLSKLSHKD